MEDLRNVRTIPTMSLSPNDGERWCTDETAEA
jgi:hypothetical protein